MPIRDHPRLRGEHESTDPDERMHKGSPPPTRGTLDDNEEYKNIFGITPAYAGNTGIYSVTIKINGDHPRLRGEHLYSKVSRLCSPGSPPPTRGTPISASLICSRAGITPAYAGNTFPVSPQNPIE